MEHFLGGYYLVQGAPRSAYMSADLIPPTFWTVSNCICRIFPDDWGVWWVSVPADELDEIRQHLNLTPAAFDDLRHEVAALMDAGQFGWPNLFLELAPALEFHRKYLRALPEIKLLSIELPASWLDEFLESQRPPSGQGIPGVYQLLSQRVISTATAPPAGYAIMGYDYGTFHSCVCNGLERDYHQQLEIPFNHQGRIDHYLQAVRATHYTRRDSTGAEPAFWAPWLIREHPF